MMCIPPQPEPPDFDAQVRQPGMEALRHGNKVLPSLWRRCLGQLWDAYGGVCAYLCIYIPRGTGARTTDHVVPKSSRPELAFEWLNLRLVCSLMNSRKGVFEDVLDPFEVEDGWFILEPSSLEVLPNPDLEPGLRERVLQTIHRLGLNEEECLAAREEHYHQYLEHLADPSRGMTLALFKQWSPFVAKELERQGVLPPRMSPPPPQEPSPRSRRSATRRRKRSPRV